MIHLTLESYHKDEPVDPEDDSHPDGLLWPVTPDEFDDLPKGTVLESTITPGNEYIVGSDEAILLRVDIGNKYTDYGIRGRREEP